MKSDDDENEMAAVSNCATAQIAVLKWLPAILAFYESEGWQWEFAEWNADAADNKAEKN